jgi:PadR family transcriptional regulator, regulatory protein AphA
MSRPERELTTTSYAILGLLAIRPWSTYELAGQMRRNLHHLWPRAESNLYAEAKRLADSGYAQARKEPFGEERERTVYTITARGRRALEQWLGQPGGESRFESETLVKILFSPFGSKAELLARLHELRGESEARRQTLRAIFEEYLRNEDAFPERVHINALCYRLLWEQATSQARSTEWAIKVVQQWPDVRRPPSRRAALQWLRDALASDDRVGRF